MDQDRRQGSPDLSLGADPPVEATFIPQRYEPNYPYPLLVLLHGKGGDEQQLVRHMPTLSWRNYVALGLRGPEVATRQGRPSGYDWGPAFHRNRRGCASMAASLSPAETVARMLRDGRADEIDRLEDHVFGSVLQTRRALHVHSERIFLVGVGEGAAVAYRMGLTYPERFAGVVAINGWLPGGAFRPLARWKACRDFPVLIAHGMWNARSPVADAQRDAAILRAAGLRTTFQTYPSAHRLTSRMLSDVDSWLISQCVEPRESR